MPNELTFSERMTKITERIGSEQSINALARAASQGVDVSKYLAHLENACRKNLKVLNCSVGSLYEALLASVTMGLPIGGPLGYGYVVPYKGVAQFQVGYQGLLHLAYNDARITTAAAEVVREGDEFAYKLGTRPFIDHVPLLEGAAERPIIAGYACLEQASGSPFVKIMPLADLDAHAQQYVRRGRDDEFPGDALYRTNPVRWYQKTLLRMALKFAPLSPVARHALNTEEFIEAGVDPEFKDGDEQPTDNLRAIVAASQPRS